MKEKKLIPARKKIFFFDFSQISLTKKEKDLENILLYLKLHIDFVSIVERILEGSLIHFVHEPSLKLEQNGF